MSILVAIVSAIASSITASAIGSFLLRAAISVGLSLVASALSRSREPDLSSFVSEARDRTHVLRSSVSPHRVIYGEVVTSGTLIFAASTGSENKFLHMVITLAGHECEEISDVFLNDDLTTDARFSGADIRVKKHLGAPGQLADTDLVSEVTEWTTDHKVSGICYLYIRLKWDTDIYPTGIPNIKCRVKGKKVYDPITTLTAWSNNWALCVRDYLTWSSGLNSPASEIDDSTVIAAEIASNESVTTDSGTQKRYTVNGTFTLASSPLDILEDLRTAGSGAIHYWLGQWRIHAGTTVTPTETLTEDDLRGSIKLRPHPSKSELFNAIRGTFTDPLSNQPTDFPAITSAAYEAEDGGNRVYRDIDLPYTDDVERAQRLATIELKRARQGITLDFPANPRSLKFAIWDVVYVHIDQFGWTPALNKKFQIVKWTLAQDGGVDLILREYSDTVYDWVDTDATILSDAPDTTLASPYVVTAPGTLTLTTGDSVASVNADGTINSRIKASWVASTANFLQSYEIQWQRSTDSIWQSVTLDSETTEFYINPVDDAATYSVRVRAINSLGVRSVFSTAGDLDAEGKTTAPTAPTSLVATGKPSSIELVWSESTEDDFGHTEIHASTTNDIGTATKIAIADANNFIHPVTAGSTYYYWVRNKDTSGNPSDFYPATTIGVTGISSFVDENEVSSLLVQGIGAVFRNGFEVYEFDDWSANPGNTIVVELTDIYAGVQSALISSSTSSDNACEIVIPVEIAQQFAGKRVRVTAVAKLPSVDPATTFRMEYYGDATYNSGLIDFTATGSYEPHTFIYDVPEEIGDISHKIRIDGDKDGLGDTTLIDSVIVQVVPDLITTANIDEWIGTAAIGTAYIGDAQITNAKIANVIQSAAYSPGTAGWKIDKAGDMELNNAIFRGTLDVKSATTGERVEITNSTIKVYDATGTLRVLIGNLV